MKVHKEFRLFFVALFFSLTSGNLMLAQSQSELREMFLEAESNFLFEEYADALPLYQKILQAEPDNDNLNYKIGICFLNNPYQKEKSIPYLEKAVKNISTGYRENSFKEKKAPPDAYYYLAKAYMRNTRLDEAIKTFNYFKEILDPNIYDASLVDKQIQSCEIAKELKRTPNYIVRENLGENINSRFAELNPLVSGDESTLIYTKKLQFYDAVFYSRKEDGKWTYPVNLTPSFALDGNSYCTGLSWDGTELFVYRSDGFDGNIYYSFRTEDKWSKLEKLNSNINTKFWESHASLSPDGKTLYFTSNRNGGFGGLDIYTSKRTDRKDWGTPVNIGPVINSEFNEDTPFLTGDGKTLYFSSQGHYNMGGFDIFYSTLLDNGNWSPPVNAGYPVNTTGDDLFFVPVKQGEFAYYSMFVSENGYGLDDIYRLEIFSDSHPRKFVLKGLALKDEKIKSDFSFLTVRLIDKKTNQLFNETKINADGTYSMDAKSGNFDLVISGKGIDESHENISIPVAHSSDIFAHQTILNPAEDIGYTESEKITPSQLIPKLEIETDKFVVNTDEPVAIKLNVDRNSSLDIEIFVNDSLLKQEHFDVNRRRFVYLYKPKEGTNILKLTLADKEGNTITKKVEIEYITREVEPLSETIAERPLKFSEAYKHLSELADGNLKKYLLELDLEKYDINSASSLYNYLIREMPGNSYTLAEIDNLFINYLAQKPLERFVEELKYPSSDKMKTYLSDLSLDSVSIYFPERLVDYLSADPLLKPFTADDLNYSLTNIASSNKANIEDYMKILNANSNRKMSFALRRIESNLKNFSEPFQLTKYLFANVGEDEYKIDDVQEMMKESSVNFDVNFLHQNMLLHAQELLKQELSDLNLYTKNIQTSKELLQYLWVNASEKGYTVKEIIDLVEYIKANSDRDLENFRQHLAKNASGNLKAVIQSLNLKEKNISTFADLLNYLINTSKFYEYNRETIYKLLLDIIDAGSLDDFIKMLRKNGSLEITHALESLDMRQFSSALELLQHLIGFTEKYKFTEQDILNLLLKLVLEKGFDTGSSEAESEISSRMSQKNLLKCLIIGNGLLLILILLFFYIRKKRKKSKKT